MTEYRGWLTPAYYTSPDAEFDAARTGAALMDTSFLGRIRVTGKDGLDLLHRLSTNDLLALKPGTCTGTVFTTDKGRVVDYADVVLHEHSLHLLVSANSEETICHWLEKYHITEDIESEIVTPSVSMCSILGPRAGSLMNAVAGVRVEPGLAFSAPRLGPGAHGFCAVVAGTVIVHIFAPSEEMAGVWGYLDSAVGREGLVKMGSVAFEAYRISRGIPVLGCELAEHYNPYEAGLREAISLTKGCYIGQEVIARLHTYEKIQRRLVGVVVQAGEPQFSHRQVLMKGREEVGWLTSVTRQAVHGKFIGLAIVRIASVKEGDVLHTEGEEVPLAAIALEFPLLA